MICLLELNKPNHSEDYWYLYLQEKLKYYNYKAKHKLKTQSGRIFEKYPGLSEMIWSAGKTVWKIINIKLANT